MVWTDDFTAGGQPECQPWQLLADGGIAELVAAGAAKRQRIMDERDERNDCESVAPGGEVIFAQPCIFSIENPAENIQGGA